MLLKPLQVFKPTTGNSKVELSTGCELINGELHVEFRLGGELDSIALSPEVQPPRFANNLWKKTCFEVFISQAKKDSYFEWNLSPSYEWAFYSFDSLRKPAIKPAIALAPLSLAATYRAKEFILKAVLPLEKSRLKRNFDIGLTAVLEGKSGELSYWAFFHLGAQPDFHRRDSFSWRLVG